MAYRIVGKGNHSTNHVQKIKPRVEAVCRDLGLQYTTENNEGRVYVNLTGGPAVMPPYHPHGPQHHPPPHGHHPQNQQQDEVEQVVQFCLPRIIHKLERACCIVM